MEINKITTRGLIQRAGERRQWRAVDAAWRNLWRGLSLSNPAVGSSSTGAEPQEA